MVNVDVKGSEGEMLAQAALLGHTVKQAELRQIASS